MNRTSVASTQGETLRVLINRRVLGRVSVRDLEVVVQEDGLVLRGRVSTYYAKQLAQHAAMEATEIPIQANEIEVH